MSEVVVFLLSCLLFGSTCGGFANGVSVFSRVFNCMPFSILVFACDLSSFQCFGFSSCTYYVWLVFV